MGKRKPSFYETDSYTGSLLHGAGVTVKRGISYQGANADFKPFLAVAHKELDQRLKESMAEEKKIYDELQKAAKAWDEHGAQTLLLQKAIEYLKTPPVKHTGNEWKQQTDGTWEISNMVYKMTFKIVPIGEEWKLSWELQYTAPGRSPQAYYSPYDRGPKKRIEYEGSKKYKTMAGAQKYIQSRFDQYVSCFETLSPPVPEAVKSLFCVNGQLLQGYTVAQKELEVSTEKTKEETVAELLEFLEDDEVSDTPPEQADPPPTPPEKTATPPTPQEKKSIQPARRAAHSKKPRTGKKSRPAVAR